jgi:leader peptidase (prepilin peptidase) / N-methyltransferase
VLPDALTLPLLVAGLAVVPTVGSWSEHVVGAAAGGAFLILVGSTFGRITGRDGLGMGDVKLFAAGGAWTGWQALPGTLLVAALLGLAYAAISGRVGEGRDRPIAFGPFLAVGIWTSWLYGPLSL